MGPVVNLVGRGIDIFIFAFGIYFLFFVIMGLRTKRTPPEVDPEHRFAVVVPAHNEQKVIGKLLENLKNFDYPDELYEIFVIADNCSDQTAARSKEYGATVLERYNQTKKGKGYALRYAFGRLGFLTGDTDYDAVVVFDADNLVDPGFLRTMNNRLAAGERIIQSYVDAKNPGDSWVTATFSMMFWINNRFNLLAHNNIKLSSVLMGTGMCIAREVIEEVGFETHTLTEDLEFSIQALERGIKTSFAHETRIYDEKPLTLSDSLRQRLRWGRGQINVAISYIPRLLRAAVAQRSLVILEGGFRLLQLFFIMLSFGSFLGRLVVPELLQFTPLMAVVLAFLRPLEYLMPSMPYLLPGLVLFIDRLPLKPFRYVIFFPVFLYSWALILYWAFFTLRKGEWMPTEHSRSMSFKEMA